MAELHSLGYYACIDKRVRSKGKQGNKSTGRAAARLKAEKRVKLMDVARCRRAGVGTRDAKRGKRESAKTRKCKNAEKCDAIDKGSMNI
jgi:hypothetical protein